ncbi:MAG: phage tail protein [Actinomycetota bacterium]|nr:phage tail protein [Actinomycetota bacterium]
MPAQEAITASRFTVSIDGVEIATFSELQGITTEIATVDSIESSDQGVVIRKIAGNPIPPKVVLKRGKTNSMQLWAWHESAVQGEMGAARKSCSLVMYDSSGKPTAKYYLERAWPSKLEVGALKAGANEVLTESVTIVCENIQRVAP